MTGKIPSISVISTVLNEVADVDAMMDSLFGQTVAPAEIVIVDGGSTDGTWEKLQAAQLRNPTLKPVRDESCNLKVSPGPIARGRNVAIAVASSEVIACADAGCVYAPEWLANLTAPILAGESEYALGGSCIDPADRTIWDIACAPFLGVSLTLDAKTKSCTARAMAFTKRLWNSIGGFPETSLQIDDSGFDVCARRACKPAFVRNAKALYRPHHSLKSAIVQLARYEFGDGVAGIRRARLVRNLARCLAEIAALGFLPWTPIPLIGVLLLEIYFALRLNWQGFRQVASPSATAARLLYSFIVPWIVCWNYLAGTVLQFNRPNPQNAMLRAHDCKSDS
jgi:glycosyltransferase involved in cell wall biosynthesis